MQKIPCNLCGSLDSSVSAETLERRSIAPAKDYVMGDLFADNVPSLRPLSHYLRKEGNLPGC